MERGLKGKGGFEREREIYVVVVVAPSSQQEGKNKFTRDNKFGVSSSSSYSVTYCFFFLLIAVCRVFVLTINFATFIRTLLS